MNTRTRQSEIALIASRTNGDWGIPKGHIEPGETSRHAAQREAFEEAGVEGFAWEPVIGRFFHRKEGRPLRYSVSVHLLTVQGIAACYPEQGERQIKWAPLTVAAHLVAHPSLGRIIASVVSHPMCNMALCGKSGNS